MLTESTVHVLRYGMVGGGPGSFIGEVHRRALDLLGATTLVAGAFSRDGARNQAKAAELGVAGPRVYADAAAMARAEGPSGGLDFAVIAAPNDVHYPAAKAFLEAGIPVACDKPLALSLAEGESLAALARATGLPFCVTYTYTGYPAVKEARRLLQAGAIGDLRFVQVEYLQEWLSRPWGGETGSAEDAPRAWRLDPSRTGLASSLGDIGTHAAHLVSYLAGRPLLRVAARLEALVPGRRLDDTASIMGELEGGTSVLFWTSQAVPGSANGLSVRLVGSTGCLSWRQEDPEVLVHAPLGRPESRLRRGRDFAAGAPPFAILPAGHPGGFHEAFAGVYAPFLEAVRSLRSPPGAAGPARDRPDYPDAEDGLAGLRFMAACAESSRRDSAWTRI